MKDGISNKFRSDSVNEDVIFAVGMSLVSGFRNMFAHVKWGLGTRPFQL